MTDVCEKNTLRAELARATTNSGVSLLGLTERAPVLLVLLRHFGCTFCREAAADVAAKRNQIEGRGATVCFVYMPGHTADVDERARAKADAFFARYDLADAPRIADPERRLYRALELRRGSFAQLFGPRVWLRGLSAGILKRHLVGGLVGDGFQMPGVFLLHRGAVVHAYRHKHAGSVPDYCSLASVTRL